VVVQPIIGFGYKGNNYDTPLLENSYAQKLKDALVNIQCNKSKDPFGWRFKVCD